MKQTRDLMIDILDKINEAVKYATEMEITKKQEYYRDNILLELKEVKHFLDWHFCQIEYMQRSPNHFQMYEKLKMMNAIEDFYCDIYSERIRFIHNCNKMDTLKKHDFMVKLFPIERKLKLLRSEVIDTLERV